MGYLIPADWNRLIQDTSLQQIISGNEQLKKYAEDAAISDIKSYLRQKYDIEKEFTETTVYNPQTATYKAANRVYLNASPYNYASLYSIGNLVLKSGSVYQCAIAIVTAEEFNISKWTLLGSQYDLFFAAYPKPVFDLKKFYEIGDQVFWNDRNYTCRIATQSIDHRTFIQFDTTTSVPNPNVFPDDPKIGATYWTDNGAYPIPAGSILSTTYFTKGDNRNQQLVMYTLDIAIYNMYRRIPPSIVPEIRITAYQYAISWLNKVAKGDDIVADIIKVQPAQGQRIRYGSRPKQENYY